MSQQTTKQSTICCLDWYAAHRTPEVQGCISKRGYVPLFNGGGTTGYEQVNDTHLHATVQRRMKSQEVAVFYEPAISRRRRGSAESSRAFRNWQNLVHAAMSQLSYKYLGQLLHLDGPIYETDIGAGLLPVLEDLD